MNLSNCRALKQELMEETQASVTETMSFSIRSATASPTFTRSMPVPVMALGVAPMRGKKKQYCLAVRAYRGQEDNARRLLTQKNIADRELDFVTGIRYHPRQLTLESGMSCGHYNITAGTLGAFVQDRDKDYMLSNNHVFADSDKALFGDSILLPGPIDIQDDFVVIGNLSRRVPLLDQRVDAALAEFSDEVDDFLPFFYDGIGEIDPTPIENRFSVTDVIKRGRTTRVTRGFVSVYELDGVAVEYDLPQGPTVVTFNDQIEITGSPVAPQNPFSAGGDSGSLIIDQQTLRPYALLYSGGVDDRGIDRTVAHFIPDVLDALGVQFIQ